MIAKSLTFGRTGGRKECMMFFIITLANNFKKKKMAIKWKVIKRERQKNT